MAELDLAELTAEIPLVLYNGERWINVGKVDTNPMLAYKQFRSMLNEMIGISYNNLTTYLIESIQSEQRKILITAKVNLSRLVRQKNYCYFLVVLKRSRRDRRKRNDKDKKSYPNSDAKARSINNKFKASIIAEKMDQVHDRANIIAEEEEEDRISNLPVDIIHYILFFLDMKYAIQTSILSKKWKHILTSMPYLNLNTEAFLTLPQFAKFVKNALSHRNHHTEVSALELKFRGVSTQYSIKNIVKYAYSHNVRQMSMMWVRCKFNKKVFEFPRYLFSCHSLKHLTLANNPHNYYPRGQSVPKSAWDFPALETLNLSYLKLGDDGDKSLNLFSKCVKLKELTLRHCHMYSLDVFNVCAPQLSNLTITDPVYFPKVFNVVAPQLENLTASVNCSFTRSEGFNILRLSTEGLDSLEKVNLSSSMCNYIKERDVPELLDLFQKLRSAQFLILDKGIIEGLSSCVDQLLHEPCPFNNLKCLKQKYGKGTMPNQLRDYFIESSPSATFIMDLPPEVARKRSKLEEEKDLLKMKIKMVKEAKAHQEKEMIEALALEFVELRSQIRLMLVTGGNQDYKLILSTLLPSIKSRMQLIPEAHSRVNEELQFLHFYQEIKIMFATHIHASEWEEIEMELGITDNVHR